MSTSNIIRLVILALVLVWIFNPGAYDDTDHAQTKTRSGLSLHTDYGTGCQYLVARNLFSVSITPRLHSDGVQVCLTTGSNTK